MRKFINVISTEEAMKVIVTGGAGFIGSHVAERLLKEGNEVTIIDDFSSGKEDNIASFRNHPKLTVHKADICDDLSELFKGVKAVFHLAALPRVQFSIAHPVETHEANVNGTLNLLELCRKTGVKRFVFSSSSSVYGDQERLPLTEAMIPNPMSPYALHKLIGEYYCRFYYQFYGVETVCLRYFNVYGPRQNPSESYACLIPKFIKMINAGQSPIINGDGKQTRDFAFISDVVEANMLAAQTKKKECFGNFFNIGGGANKSVNEVTDIILKMSKKDVKIHHGPSVIEPHDTLADVSKAKKMLDWEPKVKFEEGMKKTFEFFTQ